uniref:Peptidase M13 n=1 Tax=Compsopogon caeruleus TaxID=31354 RepID=A0A7S1XBH6_9RHOD
MTEFHAIDRSNVDDSVLAQEDFYQYANGSWVKNNPIPDDYSRWGLFEELNERTMEQLRDVVEGKAQEKVGILYGSAMDQEKIDAAGVMEPLRERIWSVVEDGWASCQDMARVMGTLHRLGVGVLFALRDAPDLKNSSWVIPWLSQGGIGLPDRDFYFLEDKEELRIKYLAHMAEVFTLYGRFDIEAGEAAKTIFEMEKRLAQASLTRVERRDPMKQYHMMSLEKLEEMCPSFEWRSYFEATGLDLDGCDQFNVTHIPFFETMSIMCADLPLGDWKLYTTWHILRSLSKYLPSAFEEANFRFYGTAINGETQMKPRWKRIITTLNNSVGELLGQAYCEKYFPEETKNRAVAIVSTIHQTLKDRIKTLDWMGDETKLKALEKCERIRVKIGFPDKWLDYSTLHPIPGASYVENMLCVFEFDHIDSIKKMNKAVDRTRWEMPPSMVNAYYHPMLNEIVFPAAILQFPFFDARSDDAVNYGAMGAVIAHELTHGYDDQGRKFDAEGNMNDWWTEADAGAFKERSSGIVDQFSQFKVHDKSVNGELTQGENIADLGGLRLAYQAFLSTSPDLSATMDGFTAMQRFFLSWAQIWRHNIRKEMALTRLLTDPHSPGHLRVNGPLRNLDEFHQAFEVKDGDRMFLPSDQRIALW